MIKDVDIFRVENMMARLNVWISKVYKQCKTSILNNLLSCKYYWLHISPVGIHLSLAPRPLVQQQHWFWLLFSSLLDSKVVSVRAEIKEVCLGSVLYL